MPAGNPNAYWQQYAKQAKPAGPPRGMAVGGLQGLMSHAKPATAAAPPAAPPGVWGDPNMGAPMVAQRPAMPGGGLTTLMRPNSR
jgi:hypothetical protein